MNDLITRIKTLDYKQFALQHGEKIGIGVIGMIILICLFLTSWASEYNKEPRDLVEQAEKVADQLKRNPWTEDKKKEFLPLLTAEDELQKVEGEIDVAAFEWTIPISPKLYPRQLPAEEPIWITVSDLRVFSESFPMGVTPPPSTDELAANDAEAKPKSSKADKKKKKDDDEDIFNTGRAPFGAGAMAGMMSGMADSAEKASGRRYNVVVGVVDVKKQTQLLRQKLHVDSLSQAAALLDYRDFHIQRQRAVPGPNPWAGEWKDVQTKASIDALAQASDFDPEIVAAKYTIDVFTSPLPHRLDSEWDPNHVGHPRIPTLTEDEQEQELLANKAAAKVAGESGDADEPGGRGGFARVQKDANRLRSQAMSTGEGAKKTQDYMLEMMKGMPGMDKARSSREPDPGAMRSSMMAGMMGMMGAGMAGATQGGLDPTSDMLLFRYFDFDVEPGECYRYRIKLIAANPSYEETFVAAPTVAEGELRESDWSSPSPPAVVESDVEYALMKVSERYGRQEGAADLKIVQFDTNLGTLIMDTLKVLYGAYVGGDVQRTMHLDVGAPTFKEEKVTFTSKDILLDSAGSPKLSAAAIGDLQLGKSAQKITKNGTLDLAVTLNRFGEIVELDADSKTDLRAAEKKVAEQREPYQEIKETIKDKKKKEEEEDDGGIFGSDPSGKTKKKGKKKKRKKVDNPLKGGSMGMEAMMRGMMPGMGGMPPDAGGSSKKSRGKK